VSTFEQSWQSYCAQHGTPERVELMLCDINAVLRGKWLPGEDIDKLTSGAARLPISTYTPCILGWEVEATGQGIVVGDPDGKLTPVLGTLQPVPWADGSVAQVLVEMTDETGEIGASSTRQLLSNVLDRFRALGLKPVVATELEFYIVKARKDASEAPTPPDRLPEAQNYDLEVLGRHSAVLQDIKDAAKQQGLATDTLIAEYGPGQFEINFHHTDDVLAAADTALLFRRLVRMVVSKHGFEATFMAKPYAQHPGNGMHAHVSLVDEDGNNALSSGADGDLSDVMQNAVAGTLATMKDLQAIFAPHLNSYRRFQPKSFAPSAPEWGLDHRACAIRIPETTGKAARLEHRISGADVNPYLALAAILGGILYGIEKKPELQLPIDHPDAQPQPLLTHDWATSVDIFAASDIAADVFGAAFRDLYAIVRREEISELTTVIAPIEYSAYLSRL
jgi:glutamine synthetase